MTNAIVILITTKDTQEAQKIADVLLGQKLIACANIVREVQSLFWWKDKIDSAQEVLMVCKSKQELFAQIEHTVKSLHSYDVPEIIAMPVVEGSKEYLKWVEQSVD